MADVSASKSDIVIHIPADRAANGVERVLQTNLEPPNIPEHAWRACLEVDIQDGETWVWSDALQKFEKVSLA